MALDGTGPIEKNREALKRILLMLVAMAEMGFGKPLSLVLQEAAAVPKTSRAGKSRLPPALSLPRHLYRAVLRLLRPAESAARRLIIAAANGIVVALPPLRPRKPKPKLMDPVPMVRILGLAVPVPHPDFVRDAAARKAAAAPRAARPPAKNLPLLDPLKYPFRIRRRYTPAHAAPRITWLDFDAKLSPLPPPPSPDDPIDAARLGQRLAALAAALDDLPGQAQRFALWKARNDAALARDRQARDAAAAQGKHAAGAVPFKRRMSPLRRGRPPGGRLSRYDPDARRRSNIREIDEILAHAHALAVYALDPPRPDTS